MENNLALFLQNEFKKRQRENWRYTFRKFADDLGVKRENLHSWLKRKIVPRVDHCHQMATALGLPIYDFLRLTGLIPPTEHDKSKDNLDNVPEVIRSAMATPEWAELYDYSDEIATVSKMPGLTDAASVIKAIRNFPIHKIKAAFIQYHAPIDLQENCYRVCRAMVIDWSQTATDRGT